MSDKRWLKDDKGKSTGIYTRTIRRGPREGRQVWCCRAWVKSEGSYKHWTFSTARAVSIRAAHRVIGDPEAAWAERNKIAPDTQLLNDLVSRFLTEYKSRGETGYYGHVAESWKGYFGNVDAAKITRVQVEAYRDKLRRDDYGDSTIRKYVGALGTMYRWAIGRGLLTANPAEGVKRPQEPSRVVVVLSREEEAALLAAGDPGTQLAVELYLASGMRCGEALRLQWGHIDKAGGAILIHTSKTGKARSIPLNVRLTAILGRAKRHVRSDYVLRDRQGQPLDRYTLTRALLNAMQAAGIAKQQGAVFNLLRHTFGSRMAEAGVDMTTLATIMGNSPDICYRHYIRFSPGHLRAAMASQDTLPHTAPKATVGIAGKSQVIVN